MNSFESQFRNIVGGDYEPSQELGAEQARALSALIFSMPETQVSRDGFFIEYEGWCEDQRIYLAVTVTDDHLSGIRAECESLDSFDESLNSGS